MLKGFVSIALIFVGCCLVQIVSAATSQEDAILLREGSAGITELQTLKTARANMLIDSYNSLIGRDLKKSHESITNFSSQHNFRILIDALGEASTDTKLEIVGVLKQAPSEAIATDRSRLLPALKEGAQIYGGREQVVIRDRYLRELLDLASKAYGIPLSKSGPNSGVLENQAAELLEKISKTDR